MQALGGQEKKGDKKIEQNKGKKGDILAKKRMRAVGGREGWRPIWSKATSSPHLL